MPKIEQISEHLRAIKSDNFNIQFHYNDKMELVMIYIYKDGDRYHPIIAYSKEQCEELLGLLKAIGEIFTSENENSTIIE